MKKNTLISVVLPAFNEESSITQTLIEVIGVCEKLIKPNSSFEVLVVDDGSTDATVKAVEIISKNDSRIKLISLAQNSGHMAAISAGLDHSKGEWVVTLDADGQDPPDIIELMFEQVKEENVDVCYAIRANRDSDPWRHRFFSPLFYFVLRKMTGGNSLIQAADYRLMSRRVVDAMRNLPERNRVYRVLVPDLRFSSTSVKYTRRTRNAGNSKYGLRKLASLGWSSILATSGIPIRALSAIAVSMAVLMLMLVIWVLFSGLRSVVPAGWTSISLFLCITLLFQSISIAIISEVLIQIMKDIRQRPLYQVKR